MTHTFAIPDLHGRRDLLDAALAAIERRPPGKVVFLGDYVDRGHESRGVVERLMAGPPPGWEWVFLQGNHEVMMLDALDRPASLARWLGHGGAQTLVSYGHPPTGPANVSVVPPAHADWLGARPLLHVDRHRVFVHACIDPDVALDRQRAETLQWRRYSPDDDAPAHGRHVVHGHDAFPDGPLLLKHRSNLDAQAWRTGRLVVGVFDDDLPGGPVEIIEVGARGTSMQ